MFNKADSNDINESFLESISNARIALSKVVVETLDNAEKCVEYFKYIKKCISKKQPDLNKFKCSSLSKTYQMNEMSDSFLSALTGNKKYKCRQFDNKVFKPPKLLHGLKNDNVTVKQILSQTEMNKNNNDNNFARFSPFSLLKL